MEGLREGKFGQLDVRMQPTKSGYGAVVIDGTRIVQRLDGDNADELWRQVMDVAARSSPNFMGYDGARERFTRIFPDGFADPEYSKMEREYKDRAKSRFQADLPLASGKWKDEQASEAALAAFRGTNLLSPFEKTWMQQALRSQDAPTYLAGAARFAEGDREQGLAEMAEALAPHGAAKWTAVTYLPFLWRPETEMFLKPEVTKAFAERVGHAFSQAYRAELDLSVYDALLSLVAETRRQLQGLDPQDNIDVQSFIWVVGAYDVSAETHSNTPPLEGD